MDKSIREKTIRGVFWKFGERASSQLVGFVVSVVLARLILPEFYGIVALIGVFTTLCNKLISSGFATSLIQKKDADELDFSTVFHFSIAVASGFALLLYISAPYISDFFANYDSHLLTLVIRVSGFQLILMAISSVQHAYVSRTMQFRRYFYSTLTGTVVSAIVGIGMAYRGYGVWALVAQYFTMSMVDIVVLWFTVKWRPRRLFSFIRLKGLFSYGWKLFTASIIKTLYNDLRSIIIGKFYTPSDLAFYNRGQNLPQMIDTNISGTIDSVLFPAMSRVQSDSAALLAVLRRAVKTSTFVTMPLLFLLAAMGDTVITILLTERWLPCVVYLQILCFSYVLAPIELENLQAIKAIGRSDIVLKLETVKRVIGLCLLVLSIPFGVKAIAYSMLANSVVCALINVYPNRKLVGYSYRGQLLDILPTFLLSSIMFFVIWLVGIILPDNLYVKFILQLLAGAIIYIGLAFLCKVESLSYLVKIVKPESNKGT